MHRRKKRKLVQRHATELLEGGGCAVDCCDRVMALKQDRGAVCYVTLLLLGFGFAFIERFKLSVSSVVLFQKQQNSNAIFAAGQSMTAGLGRLVVWRSVFECVFC